jgi:two-component system phosphate regulon response regulator PhoB
MGSSARVRPVARCVLVVEDNDDAEIITTSILRHFGYDVMRVRDIEGARRMTRARRPDVVLLDCRLPDGDGLELARAWRQDGIMRDVPVIVLTAFCARQDIEAALVAGADAFLVKPCPAAVLAAQIEKVLAGTRPSQALRVRT